MEIVRLGLVDYARAVELQLAAVEEVLAGGPERAFLLEHPPTVTVGRMRGAEHLLVSPEFLAGRGVALHHSQRGGSITCHFPGQLVCYPIRRVAPATGGLKGHVARLEQAAITLLADLGITAERDPERPGAWVNGNKIASVGVAARRWVSYHGLSLNVASDLSTFELVTPCGLPGVRQTSISQERGRETAVAEIIDGFAQRLREAFAHPAVAAHPPA